LGHHRVEERNVIDAAGEVRQQVADPQPALAAATEDERTLHEAARLAEEGVDLTLAGQLLAVMPGEIRLVVEGIDVAHPAGAEDLDDALRLRGEVRPPRACRF